MIDQRKYGLEKIRLLNVRRKLMEKREELYKTNQNTDEIDALLEKNDEDFRNLKYKRREKSLYENY